jgi:hypothetical protein
MVNKLVPLLAAGRYLGDEPRRSATALAVVPTFEFVSSRAGLRQQRPLGWHAAAFARPVVNRRDGSSVQLVLTQACSDSREKRMRRTVGMRGVAALVLVVALAGCKSGASSPAPASPTPSSGTATSAPASASCVIPQGNGGDHDADNNGGPDDGDGCDK